MQIDGTRLAEIAWFYYKKEWPQYKIAQEFGLSRAIVSRMLNQAKKEKIVNVEIKTSFKRDRKLENEIISRYNIRKAHVVDESDENILDSIGRTSAFITSVNINEGDVIGLSVGRTIARMIQYLTPRYTKNIQIVQLIGGFGKVVDYDPCSLVHEMCRKLRAEGTYYNSLAIVRNMEVKEHLRTEPCFELWKKCNKAIFGIGPTKESILFSTGLINKEEMTAIEKKGGVGEILGHYFDEDGNNIRTDIDKWVESIPLKMLQLIPERVGVAGGENKVKAIKGVLNSGLITNLITNRKTALLIIETNR